MKRYNSPVFLVQSKNCWSEGKKPFAKRNVPNATHLKNVNAAPNKLQELSQIIPGLKYVLDSRKGFVFNLLWLLVIGCSIFICFYQICERLQLFISNPIDSRITITQNDSVKFPSLTICSPEERYPSLVNRQYVKSKAEKIPICNVTVVDLMPELNISTIWSLMNLNGLIKDITIMTKLQGQNHENRKTLSKNWGLTYFGNCTTHSISNLIPFRGEDYRVRIPVQPLQHHPCGFPFLTALYFFHHDDEDITYRIIQDYTYLITKRFVAWGIEVKRFRTINRSGAPCDTTAVASQCERRCVENILKKRFTCRLPFMKFEDIPLCTNSTQAREVYKETYNIVLGIVYSTNCSCPDRCDKILYSRSLMYGAQYPVSVLEYFFDSNVILDIQEYYSYTVIPFICDVGGNLGLFLGLCIPAIIDIFQNIIGYAVTRINRALMD